MNICQIHKQGDFRISLMTYAKARKWAGKKNTVIYYYKESRYLGQEYKHWIKVIPKV